MTDIKKGNRFGLFMVVPTSTLSAVLKRYEGNYTIDNDIRVEVFGPYAVLSAQADNVVAHGLFLDLTEGWDAIEPAFREAMQEGMSIPVLFFELGTLWHVTRDHAPSDEVTFQRLCPYLMKARGEPMYSGDCDEAEG